MENLNNVPNTGTFGNSVSKINSNFDLIVNAINSLEYKTTRSKGIKNNGFVPSTTTLPNAVSGDWCMVLGTDNTFPARIWSFNGTTWTQGGEWNPGGINLTDYATKAEMNAAIVQAVSEVEIETVDNLNEETAASGKALDAHQGFVLAGQIEDVQDNLDELSELALEKHDLNLTGNYVGKYALNKTTGGLVSNSYYRLYEFNLSQYTDKGSLFITGGKGSSDVGVIGQYDSDGNLVGTVYAAATNNKEFAILDGAVTLKVSVYPDSYTVRLVYIVAPTKKIDALTSAVASMSDEIDNLNDITENIPSPQAWDAAMKLGTRLSDSGGYNSKYAFAFKKEITETMVIDSIEHPSVSELSVDVIIVNPTTLKIEDKKRVVLDGTKTELLNDAVVIPKGCYIGFAAPSGAVSTLTGFKYKSSDYEKTSPSGYVFDSSAIGSIGAASSYNTCTYVINMREYNSILSQIEELATTQEEEYTEKDCVVAKRAINANTGIVTANGWSSTQFISIKGYKVILFSVDYTSTSYGIAFYDSEKNVLSNKGIAFHSETNTYYVIPNNAEYIRFCAKDDGTIHVSITLETTGLNGFMKKYSGLQEEVEELKEKTSSIKTKLRILAVGNSYTMNSMEYVAQILSNMGIDNVTIYYLYHSGASLSHWLGQYDSGVDDIIAYHACGEQDIVREASLATLFESNWDIVSFQQYSVDSVDYSTYTALARLIAAVKEHCTNPDVKIAWHLTWSRWSSESGNPRGLAGYNNIVSAVRQMLNDYTTVIDYIIPTGTAMQNARNTSLNTTHELTADNGGHASAGVGRYIIALTWIQSLVCPFAGKRLIDDDVFTIDVSSVSQSYETENVTDENRMLCQRVALAACSNPFNVTSLE